MLPLTALQAEQVWLMQAWPMAPQSASTQQLPGVQLPPQQKSPELAVQAWLLFEQRRVTHLPVPVLQMVLAP